MDKKQFRKLQVKTMQEQYDQELKDISTAIFVGVGIILLIAVWIFI